MQLPGTPHRSLGKSIKRRLVAIRRATRVTCQIFVFGAAKGVPAAAFAQCGAAQGPHRKIQAKLLSGNYLVDIPRRTFRLLAIIGSFALPPAMPSQTAVDAGSGPVNNNSWLDRITGHRITKVSEERSATAMYFTQNIVTPDGADMIYASSVGIHVVHLADMQGRLRYKGHVVDVVMGSRTRRVFFRQEEDTSFR